LCELAVAAQMAQHVEHRIRHLGAVARAQIGMRFEPARQCGIGGALPLQDLAQRGAHLLDAGAGVGSCGKVGAGMGGGCARR